MTSLIYSLLEFLITFLEFFIAYMVLDAVFGENKGGTKLYPAIVASLAGAGLIILCNGIALFSYLTIVIAGIYLTLTGLWIYKKDTVIILSVVSFYLLCLNSIDFLILTIVYQGSRTLTNIISEQGMIRAVTIVLVKSIWIILYIGLRKYLQRIAVNKKAAYLLLFISLSGFAGFIFLVEQTMDDFHVTIPFIFLIMSFLLAALIFLGYFRNLQIEGKQKLDILKVRNDLLLENYNALNEVYASNARLYHDLNNHLNTLYQLMEEKQWNQAQEYIMEISRPVMQLSKKVWTGFDVVDVVINTKIHKMEEMGIEWEINVEFPENTNILVSDLCTILSNLLDNAIEAANLQQKERTPKVSLTIRRINHFIVIKISNPFTGQLETDPETGLLITGKADKQKHGWGLESVKSAVQKYNGTLKYCHTDGIFSVTVLLFY